MQTLSPDLLTYVTGGSKKHEQKPELPPLNGNTSTTGNPIPRATGGWAPQHGAIRDASGARAFGGGGASLQIPLGQMRVMR